MMRRLGFIFLAAVGAVGLSACDEFPGSTQEFQDSLALRSCIAAVQRHTGTTGARLNTTIPVVELNQYIIDTPGRTGPYTCITEDNGRARFIFKTRTGAA